MVNMTGLGLVMVVCGSRMLSKFVEVSRRSKLGNLLRFHGGRRRCRGSGHPQKNRS